MNKMKVKRVIKDVSKMDGKFGKVVETMERLKEAISIPCIELSDILMKLNKNEILINQEIEVTGYLSNMAYFDFPTTYCATTINEAGNVEYEFTKDENGDLKKMRKFQFQIKELYPPVFYSPYTEENRMFCFLYQDQNCMKIDIEFKNDRYRIKMNDRNKYIPILVDLANFQRFKNKRIRIIVRINMLTKETMSLLLENSDSEYRKLIECFCNPYLSDFTGIFLTIQDIQEDSKACIDQIYHNYGLEFAFTNTEIQENVIKDKILQVINEYTPVKDLINCSPGENCIVYYMKEKFSVHYHDCKIGFYRQFSDDIIERQEERRDFFHKVDKIMNDIHLKCEVSFISDEKDLILFDQNESIDYDDD